MGDPTVVNKNDLTITAVPGGGWFWVINSTPPSGEVGFYRFASGYTVTLLGAWWKSRRALRTASPHPPIKA